MQLPTSDTLKPEWLRIPESVKVSGIGRSLLYERLATGEIKSAVVKKRGAVRGIRLVNYDSLMAFIEAAVEKPEAVAA